MRSKICMIIWKIWLVIVKNFIKKRINKKKKLKTCNNKQLIQKHIIKIKYDWLKKIFNILKTGVKNSHKTSIVENYYSAINGIIKNKKLQGLFKLVKAFKFSKKSIWINLFVDLKDTQQQTNFKIYSYHKKIPMILHFSNK